MIYVPYWRFKGMVFSCSASGIEDRFLDTSQKAVSSMLFPPSVGLRSQAMKLSFVRPEINGWFIKPEFASSRAVEAVIRRYPPGQARQVIHQAIIGESLSLIYAPFYLGEQMMDAVLNQPATSLSVHSFDRSQFNGGPAIRSIRFIPTLCPNCGWDLEGQQEALVLCCRNCRSMWKASKKGMKRITVAHMPEKKGATSLFLPFWRIRADVTGIDLKSYADLVKHANLPKAIQPEWNQTPMYFWGPAFKVRPQSFLRLTHQITLSQPGQQLVPEIPGGTISPVTLPLSESIETLKLNLAGIIRPKKRIQECLPMLRVQPERFLLVYLPFQVGHHDLVQTSFNIAINRNQLALADNL